jgi:hypothetical protein
LSPEPLIFKPGQVLLMGSGETTYYGGRMFDAAARTHGAHLKISLLETPAGFELNSTQVAGKVAEFLGKRLQNFQPEIQVIPARHKQSPYSVDDLELLEPLLASQMVFMGPGSPSYAVRQLAGSLAWGILQAKHRLGASLVLASAATIAIGKFALPVYEIYKAGEDPYWLPGLDLFSDYGLSLVFVPHWNNAEGGVDLDTSRCFMGKERFNELFLKLPQPITVLGLEEHSGILIDPQEQICTVLGKDGIVILSNNNEKYYRRGSVFSINELGDFKKPTDLTKGIASSVWRLLQKAQHEAIEKQNETEEVPAVIKEFADLRAIAREMSNWTESDVLREKIASLGWQVIDSPSGQEIKRKTK